MECDLSYVSLMNPFFPSLLWVMVFITAVDALTEAGVCLGDWIGAGGSSQGKAGTEGRRGLS